MGDEKIESGAGDPHTTIREQRFDGGVRYRVVVAERFGRMQFHHDKKATR